MVQPLSDKFAMPSSSWETVQRIIRAYHAANAQERPTVNEIAQLAGLQRPIVSSNNNFLRELGFLQTEVNKLTPLGARFANGLELGNKTMTLEALEESVQNSPNLKTLISTLRARGTMSVEAFKAQLITLAQLTANSPTLGFLRAVIDYLEDAKVLKNEGDSIVYTGHGFSPGRAKDNPDPLNPPPPPPPPPTEETGVPIPLGVGRLAYLKLPERWTSRELPKLLKLIELALGDDDPES